MQCVVQPLRVVLSLLLRRPLHLAELRLCCTAQQVQVGLQGYELSCGAAELRVGLMWLMLLLLFLSLQQRLFRVPAPLLPTRECGQQLST